MKNMLKYVFQSSMKSSIIQNTFRNIEITHEYHLQLELNKNIVFYDLT